MADPENSIVDANATTEVYNNTLIDAYGNVTVLEIETQKLSIAADSSYWLPKLALLGAVSDFCLNICFGSTSNFKFNSNLLPERTTSSTETSQSMALITPARRMPPRPSMLPSRTAAAVARSVETHLHKALLSTFPSVPLTLPMLPERFPCIYTHPAWNLQDLSPCHPAVLHPVYWRCPQPTHHQRLR